MCGCYLGLSAAELEDIVKIVRSIGKEKMLASLVPIVPDTIDSASVFPAEQVPVLVGSGGEMSFQSMQWGYPGYVDREHPAAKPRPLINAKAETALMLPTWRDSIINRRCVIPSAGFYEWQHGETKERTKYLFTKPGETVVFMAGIYRFFALAEGGQTARFSILTTEANASMKDVHNRMPVVLNRQELAQWLWGDWSGLLDRRAVELTRKKI